MMSILNILTRLILGVRISASVSQSAVTDEDDLHTGDCNYVINRKKSFDDLAADARETLDTGYQRIGKHPEETFSDNDWRAAGLGTLPRRGVFAIANNHRGKFSECEIAAAKWRMAQLHHGAMRAVNPFDLEYRRGAMLKASLQYLERADSEEKSSLEWSESVAAAQAALSAWTQSERDYEDASTDEILAA